MLQSLFPSESKGKEKRNACPHQGSQAGGDSLTLKGISALVFVQASADWMRPTHIEKEQFTNSYLNSV